MTTELDSTLDQDQDQTDTADQADVIDDDFNARKASKTLAEKMNKLEKQYEEKIAALEKRFAPEPVVEESGEEEDLDTKISRTAESIVAKKEWQRENKALIDSLSEENKELFENKSKTMDLQDALDLALHREGITVQTKEKMHSAGGSIKREAADELTPQERKDMETWGHSKETILEQRKLKASRRN